MKRVTAICLTVIMGLCTIFCTAGCESKQKLYLYNWGDYMDPDVIAAFEKEYNVDVVEEYFDRNEDMYIKVKNGSSNYDVLVPSEYMIERLIKDDLLYKLDFNNIPNYSNISQMVLNMSNGVDLEYMVPYMWGTLGILYNPDVVSDEEAKSWDVLWNEKYSRRIVMIDSVRDSMAAALIKLGYSINTVDENEIEEAAQLLKDQLPLVLSYETDTIKDMLSKGTADVAITYSGEAVAAKALAEEKAKSEDNEESEEDSDSEDDDNDSDNDETSEDETSTDDDSEKEVEEESTEDSDDNDTDTEKENTEEIEISEGEENK